VLSRDGADQPPVERTGIRVPTGHLGLAVADGVEPVGADVAAAVVPAIRVVDGTESLGDGGGVVRPLGCVGDLLAESVQNVWFERRRDGRERIQPSLLEIPLVRRRVVDAVFREGVACRLSVGVGEPGERVVDDAEDRPFVDFGVVVEGLVGRAIPSACVG
jgi:hypothetical protein